MTLLTRTLQHLEAIPLEYNQELRKLTGYPDNVRIMMYDSLKGKRLQDILNHKHWGVILLMTVHGTNSPIGHFVSMHLVGKKVMWFDPYGLSLEERLLSLTKSKPFVLDMVHSADGYELVENDHHIQQMKDSSQVCGRHVCMRLRMRNLSHEAYADFISGIKCLTADQTVCLMTMLYHSKRPHGYTGDELHKILGGWLRQRGLW